MQRKRVLSGMRPTGRLHIGNLVGALMNWRMLQDQYDCFFMIADYHALMSEYANPSTVRDATREVAIDYIACGLDPARSAIFRQSDVPEHTELHLILSCYTPLGWLERCPTYKEQMQELKAKDVTNYAFLGYPVLQAADITLYKADVVPVGEDQLPHLELTREIVRRFNNLIKKEILVEPQPKLTEAARLLGLDGRKMSKSYGNQIDIADEPEVIEKKVASMFTDPKRIKRNDPGHCEECNVFDYYKAFCPADVDDVTEKCRNAQWGCTDCKRRLAEVLTIFLSEPRSVRKKLEENPGRIDEILAQGAAQAQKVARATLDEVKAVTGLGPLHKD